MRRALLLLVISACLTLVSTELAFGFWGSGFYGLLNFCLVGLCGVLVLFAIKKKSKSITALSASLAFAIVTSVIVSNQITGSRTKGVTRDAEVVISALGEYHSVYGRYPSTLLELVPDFIYEVPRARVSVFVERDFYYSTVWKEGEYWLSFDLPAFMAKGYDSESSSWQTGD